MLLIKGTDSNKFVNDIDHGTLDRNRRGLIVLSNKAGYFEPIVKNYTCFSSENEDGGVYFPPELFIDIKKGNLYIGYSHGRYGHWQFTFRGQGSDFELIGYDEANGGAVIENDLSINFLSKKKLTRVNSNEDAQGGDEDFTETWQSIHIDQLIKLSEIKDFDELNVSEY